jgi:hypothetical protein
MNGIKNLFRVFSLESFECSLKKFSRENIKRKFFLMVNEDSEEN